MVLLVSRRGQVFDRWEAASPGKSLDPGKPGVRGVDGQVFVVRNRRFSYADGGDGGKNMQLRSFAQAAHRALLRPALDVLATTEAIICDQKGVAAGLIAPSQTIGKATTYFVTTFSLALILNRIGLATLGLESLSDAPYWIVHAGIVLVVALVAYGVVASIGSFAPLGAINATLLAFGAAFFVCGSFLAGTAATIRAAQEIGYIPPVIIDFSLMANNETAFEHALTECIRKESLGFSLFYHAAFGHFEAAHEPIDDLSYTLPASYVLATGLLGILAWFASTRRRWATAIAVLLAAASIQIGTAWAVSNYLQKEYENPACDDDSIMYSTIAKAADDHAAAMATRFSDRIGRRLGPGLTLTGVESDQGMLIFRIMGNPSELTEGMFRRWVERVRRDRIAAFCSSDWGLAFRRTGRGFVWIVRYGENGPVERVIESADSCRK